MKAVFIDRDGVINGGIYDFDRCVYRPPWNVSEFKLLPNVVESLRRLSVNDYGLFLVTNQPDYVKGFISLDELKQIKNHLINIMIKNEIFFKKYCYCFHHPSKEICECRKPSPYFLLKAAEEYHIDLKNSWMVGDRSKDIECGKNAGTKTILIMNDKKRYVGDNPNYIVNNIKEAVDLILDERKEILVC